MADVSDDFSALMDHVDFPMWFVTTSNGHDRAGCMVGFTTQASISPPRFLVGLSRANHTTRVAAGATHVAVHLLRRDSLDLAHLFGEQTGDRTDKFAQCRWSLGPHDLPVLDDAAAWFVGRVVHRFDLGDHIGFLLDPVAVRLPTSPAAVVTYADVKDFDPGHDA